MSELSEARERLRDLLTHCDLGRYRGNDLPADIRKVLDGLDASEEHVGKLTEELDTNYAIAAAPSAPATPPREGDLTYEEDWVGRCSRPASPQVEQTPTGACDCFPTPDNPVHHPSCPASWKATEVEPSNAPSWYSSEEASAWAAGYNHARSLAPSTGTPK